MAVRRSGSARVTVVALAVLLGGGGAAGAYAVLGGGEEGGAGPGYAERRLLFGTARRDGGPAVTEAEFRAFVNEVITPRFPAGLTVREGYGQWRDPRGVIEEGRSYEVVLSYAAADEAASDRKVEEVREAYEARFGREAVGGGASRAPRAWGG